MIDINEDELRAKISEDVSKLLQDHEMKMQLYEKIVQEQLLIKVRLLKYENLLDNACRISDESVSGFLRVCNLTEEEFLDYTSKGKAIDNGGDYRTYLYLKQTSNLAKMMKEQFHAILMSDGEW